MLEMPHRDGVVDTVQQRSEPAMNTTTTLWQNGLFPFEQHQQTFILASDRWFLMAAIVILLAYVVMAAERDAADS